MQMSYIVMNSIGKFNPHPQGYQYALNVIDMLMNYTWCTLLCTKETAEVVHTYLVNVYSKFGKSHRILSENGTEFKNKLFTQVAFILGIKQIHISLYYPWGNRCIDNVHNFLKTFMQKHVYSQITWDEVVHLTCGAYHFVPKQTLKKQCIIPDVRKGYIHATDTTI